LEQLDLDKAAFIGRDRNLCPCSFMLAFLYLDRLGSCNPQYLQNVSSDKVFIASLMAAGKYLYDFGEDNQVYNSDWADMLNTPLEDINTLELEFLDAIDWNVYISDSVFADKFSILERFIAFSESLKRGWFSYTDVDVLFKQEEFAEVWKTIKENVIKVLAVCMTTYLVGIFTIVASVYTADRITTTAINTYNSQQSPQQCTETIQIIDSESPEIVPDTEILNILWTDGNESDFRIDATFPNQSSTFGTSVFDYKSLSSAVFEIYEFSKIPIVATWHYEPWKIIK